MMANKTPERAPIKKTKGGNFEIDHPGFRGTLFEDWFSAFNFWDGHEDAHIASRGGS